MFWRFVHGHWNVSSSVSISYSFISNVTRGTNCLARGKIDHFLWEIGGKSFYLKTDFNLEFLSPLRQMGIRLSNLWVFLQRIPVGGEQQTGMRGVQGFQSGDMLSKMWQGKLLLRETHSVRCSGCQIKAGFVLHLSKPNVFLANRRLN